MAIQLSRPGGGGGAAIDWPQNCLAIRWSTTIAADTELTMNSVAPSYVGPEDSDIALPLTWDWDQTGNVVTLPDGLYLEVVEADLFSQGGNGPYPEASEIQVLFQGLWRTGTDLIALTPGVVGETSHHLTHTTLVRSDATDDYNLPNFVVINFHATLPAADFSLNLNYFKLADF